MRWAGFCSSVTFRCIPYVKEKLYCSTCQRSKASGPGAGSSSVRLFKYCLGLRTNHLALCVCDTRRLIHTWVKRELIRIRGAFCDIVLRWQFKYCLQILPFTFIFVHVNRAQWITWKLRCPITHMCSTSKRNSGIRIQEFGWSKIGQIASTFVEYIWY